MMPLNGGLGDEGFIDYRMMLVKNSRTKFGTVGIFKFNRARNPMASNSESKFIKLKSPNDK